ncbi:facilitated trehalose transporter Tret1-like [Leptopilina heterotoma]|uniref:facilitated trehalose transporter Tret1-like n=1 Tax=Leptopilina heterotoma TaxID=63436 RepID=UPI001CA9F367|nr:facilitated trehalose transporter Tret1-like [Leptopilina heterotoma]
MIADGTSSTWSSPALPYLTSEDSEFRLTVTEGAWLVSIVSLSGIIGYLLLPLLSNHIGRKYTLLTYGILLLLSMIIIQLANNFPFLLAGRTIFGIGSAGIYGLLPLYIGEIVHENVRGSFLTFDKMCVNIGAFLMTCAGAFFSYRNMNLVILLIPLIGICIFPLTLETPYYYLLKKRDKEAIAMKMKLTRAGKIEEVMPDIERMRNSIDDEERSTRSSLADLFLDTVNRKALVIKLMTSATYAFSGYLAIQAYAQDLFASSGTPLKPEYCVMIMTGIQIFAGLPSSRLVDIWGRRPTFLLSGVFSSLTLIILGIFFYLKTFVDLSSVTWIPLLVLIMFTFFCNMGLTTIPYLYMGELFSIRVKGVATMVSLIIECLFTFVARMILPLVNEWLGMFVSFWIYASTCLLGTIIVFVIAPETRGKNLEEVLEMFKLR